MATYVIGDIQGCYDPLRRLLDKAQFDPGNDRLYALGDLINRGPSSLAVVRFLRSLGDAFATVLGNHDLHFLAAAYGVRKPKKKDTLEALLNAPECEELVAWFRNWPLAIYQHDVLMVHAGVPPKWTLEQTLARAGEVEDWLRSPLIREFLTNMYGDVPPGFHESQVGVTRARTITNTLTRMRFCDANGRLDFASKGDERSGPVGMLPWFAHPNRALAGTHIAFGHWAMLYGRVRQPNVSALDTACVWGRELTMMRLEDRVRLSCPCAQAVSK